MFDHCRKIRLDAHQAHGHKHEDAFLITYTSHTHVSFRDESHTIAFVRALGCAPIARIREVDLPRRRDQTDVGGNLRTEFEHIAPLTCKDLRSLTIAEHNRNMSQGSHHAPNIGHRADAKQRGEADPSSSATATRRCLEDPGASGLQSQL